MQVYEGEDLWECDGFGWIVIPTNIGWKKDGSNPMGQGLAKEAAERYPWLPEIYGMYCQLKGDDVAVKFDLRSRIVLFPTKPLNADSPHMSWRGRATLDRVRLSAQQLNAMLLPHKDAEWPNAKPLHTNHIILPVVGCGMGRLDEDDVLPVLHEELDDRHTLYQQRLF
jgi:hypothetical protein